MYLVPKIFADFATEKKQLFFYNLFIIIHKYFRFLRFCFRKKKRSLNNLLGRYEIQYILTFP